VDRIAWHGLTLTVKASRTSIEIRKTGATDEPCFIVAPSGKWKTQMLKSDGTTEPASPKRRKADGAYIVPWADSAGVRFTR
jgi:hypothetical protein